jgi:asparagine synthetase B (glutamine-hydrolysing)
MCGIDSVIFSRTANSRCQEVRLYYMKGFRLLVLAPRRLALFHPSAHEYQPVGNGRRRFGVVCNGEIYN